MRSHRRSPKVRPDLFIETVPLSKNNDIAKEIYREIANARFSKFSLNKQ